MVAGLVGKQKQSRKNSNEMAKSSASSSSSEPAKPIGIILAPTRELAMQIELEAEKLTHAMPSLQSVVVYGGANAKAQLKELAFACSSSDDDNHLIVVATPGRLTDFVDRNLVSLSNVQYLVLDEADRCLDM
jgi:ATP-dependent RNA helicase DDX3X